ncbi:DUF1080 domain-containing protein [bacterium]|nr:DUF1080 domain-containing protein [bacterium]
MTDLKMRVFLFLSGFVLLSGLLSCTTETGWTSLFNGKNLDGWKASENPGSFSVENGELICRGPRAHLFYKGDQEQADISNFEFSAEVLTKPGANSGIYFHTRFQEDGWPSQGYEVQVNNSHKGEGDYRELKKTASLYGVRNLYKAMARDDKWFRIGISVRGKRIQVSLDGIPVVDYTEPEKLESGEPGRSLSSGTFALQCHDPGSEVHYRNIRVKILPDDPGYSGYAAAADSIDEEIVRLGMENFPVLDLHVHAKGGLTPEKALENSRKTGIFYGIAANCGLGFPISDDRGIEAYLKSMQGIPAFIGMQAEGREWTGLFSRKMIDRFDYVFTDAMTFTDDQGRRMRLWIPEEVHVGDRQAFMDMLVNRIASIMENEPIDIYVNATFLPDTLASEYDSLWTPERMQQVIDAAVSNGVAVEINARYRIPSEAFIRRAKEAGVKFTFGTNNADADLGRLEYCLDMARKCGLTWQDMWVPDRTL